MTKSQANAARSIGWFCVTSCAGSTETFHLPVPNLPDLDPSIIDPEGAAALVRSEWRIGDAPVSNVLHLLELHGVRVFGLAAQYREVDAFSFCARRHPSTPFVLVGTHKTPERAVFDLAHELGHSVIHRDHRAPCGREAEFEADAFASSFLMPKSDVIANAPRFPSLKDLIDAKRWRVSVAALNYRLRKLNLITEWHYRTLCIEIGRMGRNIEPESLPL